MQEVQTSPSSEPIQLPQEDPSRFFRSLRNSSKVLDVDLPREEQPEINNIPHDKILRGMEKTIGELTHLGFELVEENRVNLIVHSPRAEDKAAFPVLLRASVLDTHAGEKKMLDVDLETVTPLQRLASTLDQLSGIPAQYLREELRTFRISPYLVEVTREDATVHVKVYDYLSPEKPEVFSSSFTDLSSGFDQIRKKLQALFPTRIEAHKKSIARLSKNYTSGIPKSVEPVSLKGSEPAAQKALLEKLFNDGWTLTVHVAPFSKYDGVDRALTISAENYRKVGPGIRVNGNIKLVSFSRLINPMASGYEASRLISSTGVVQGQLSSDRTFYQFQRTSVDPGAPLLETIGQSIMPPLLRSEDPVFQPVSFDLNLLGLEGNLRLNGFLEHKGIRPVMGIDTTSALERLRLPNAPVSREPYVLYSNLGDRAQEELLSKDLSSLQHAAAGIAELERLFGMQPGSVSKSLVLSEAAGTEIPQILAEDARVSIWHPSLFRLGPEASRHLGFSQAFRALNYQLKNAFGSGGVQAQYQRLIRFYEALRPGPNLSERDVAKLMAESYFALIEEGNFLRIPRLSGQPEKGPAMLATSFFYSLRHPNWDSKIKGMSVSFRKEYLQQISATLEILRRLTSEQVLPSEMPILQLLRERERFVKRSIELTEFL